MRNGQNKRMRGRHNNQRKNHHNPMSRVYESNGPDVKIRGTPSHIAEKYIQLARDAHTSGDPVSAENYYQHAEHYFRLIAAAQEQFRQNNPHFQPPPQHDNSGARDDVFDDDDGQQPMAGAGEAPFGSGEPQPYLPREAQPYQPRDQHQHHQQPQHQHYQQPQHNQHQQHHQPRPQQQAGLQEGGGDVERLPSFITGGQPQQQGQPPQHGYGQNGHDNQPDRFPLHRRRRRHRGGGPRHDMPGGQHNIGGDDAPPRD